MKKILLSSIIFLILCMSFVSAEIADYVVISEVLVDSSGAESDYEFVELHNPTNQDIDISNWDIAYAPATFSSWSLKTTIPASSKIPAHGYFLIGGSLVEPNPDFVDTSLGFAQTGGHIAIRNASDDVIDKVGYGTANNPEGGAALVPSTDESIERKSGTINDALYGNGRDTNDNLNDFDVQATPGPQNSSNCKEGLDFVYVAKQDCEHTTIQSAITDASAGDMIYVGDGTYIETVNVNEEVSIIGVGDTTIIQPAQDSDGIVITADNVLIQDLKVSTSNSGVNPNIAINIQETDGVTLDNNVIETTGNTAMGIWIGGSSNGMDPSTNLNILNNVITINNEATGIYAAHSNPVHSGWTIGGSLANTNTITAELGLPIELYDVSDSEVSYNTLTTSASGGAALIWSSELSDISNLIFNNNVVDYSGGSQVAFLTDFVEVATGNPIPPDTTVTTVTISGNTFDNWGSRGLRIGEGVSAVTASNNKFLSTGESLKNEDTSEVNAENNYWGSANPDFDTIIVGNVDYEPWIEGIEEETVDGDFTFDVTNQTSTKLNITTNSSVKVTVTKKNVINQSSFSASNIKGFKTVDIDTTDDNSVQFPVYMEIYYTDDELADAGMTEEQLIGMFWYNPSTDLWELLNETGVDTTDVNVGGREYSGYVWANLYHFSQYAPGGDITPPDTTDVVVTPSETSTLVNSTLSATITDPTAANYSYISAAEYHVNTSCLNGSGYPMDVTSGSFNDSTTEDVIATIDTSSLLGYGNLTIYVHGKDEAGNWGLCNTTVLYINSPLTWVAAPTNQPIDEDNTLIYDLNVNDADNDIITYYVNGVSSFSDATGDYSINSSGTLEYMPTENYNGAQNITLSATDGYYTIAGNITINVISINDLPYFTSTPAELTAIEAIEYVYDADANDIDSNVSALEFSITTNHPGGATINNSTGEFRWTPDATHFGLNLVEIKVTDPESDFTTQKFNITVLPVLDMVNITINGEIDPVESVAPGDILNVEYMVMNRFPDEPNNAIVGIDTDGKIDAFGLTQSEPTFYLEGQEKKTVTYEFQIPHNANQPTFDLVMFAEGFDLYDNYYNSSKTINFSLDRDFHKLEITNITWSEDNLTCMRDTNLTVRLVNTGNWNEEGTVTVYNEKTDTNKTQDFALIIAEETTLDFEINATAATSTEEFTVTVSYRHDYYSTEDSIDLLINGCLKISELNDLLKVNESEAPSWSSIDLKNYTFGDTTGLVYTIISENDTLINCDVSGDSTFGCETPADGLFGISVINMSVGDVYEQFVVEVLSKNDPPVIHTPIPDVTFDEGENNDSVDLDDYVSDIDNDELIWSVSGNSNVTITIDADNVVTFGTANENWHGDETITFTVSDGELNASQNILVNVTQLNDDLPSITSYSPDYNPLIGDGVSQEFSITIDDPDNIEPIISWYVNGVLKDVDVTAFSWNDTVDFEVKVNITDATTDNEHVWNVDVSTVPVTTYSGTINNVNDSNVNAFSNLTIINSNGKIDFGNQVINLSNVVDVDRFVKIEGAIVSIDSDVLGMFDIPTTITLYGLTYNQEPVIYFSDEFTTNPDEIITECTSCTLISFTDYPTGSGTVVFSVTGFSSYKVRTDSEPETPPPAGTGVLQIKDVDVDEDNPKPDEIVEIVVEVENDGDLDIEDIELIIELRDEDGDVVEDEDNDDLEDDVDFDLDEGDEETFEFTFKMPADAKDGDEYIVYVEACGEDDDGVEECAIDQSETIKIERESHEVQISSAVVSPSTITCYDSFDISVGLKNIGKKDEEVQLTITSNELEISNSQIVELEAHDSDDYKTTISEAFAAPSDLAEGVYTINIRAEYNDEEETETLQLTKAKCKRISVEPEAEEDIIIVEKPVTTTPAPEAIKPRFKDSFEYMILLSILIVLILGLAIFTIGAVIIRNK